MLQPPVEPRQYVAADYAALCRDFEITRSMGRVGTSADNALAESFNATLKRETLHGTPRWTTPAPARLAVFKWIMNYNSRRRHSACGHLSPIAYENAHITAAATLEQAA